MTKRQTSASSIARFRLGAHAVLEAAARRGIEAGRVEQPEVQVGDAAFAFAAVARDARLVVDKRDLAADQPVEQRRFADIRPAKDGDRRGHRMTYPRPLHTFGVGSAQSDQLGIIGEQIDRAIGDDGRNIEGVAHLRRVEGSRPILRRKCWQAGHRSSPPAAGRRPAPDRPKPCPAISCSSAPRRCAATAAIKVLPLAMTKTWSPATQGVCDPEMSSRPLPLAVGKREGGHAAGIGDRKDLIAVDDRPAGDSCRYWWRPSAGSDEVRESLQASRPSLALKAMISPAVVGITTKPLATAGLGAANDRGAPAGALVFPHLTAVAGCSAQKLRCSSR